jgi:tRNA pseudouridine38-40 synthase
MGVSTVVPDRWTPTDLRRGLNAPLPEDCWAAACREMKAGFHARKCASYRRYRYVLGTDDASRSPFRKRYEWALGEPVEGALLEGAAAEILGEHDFSAFSVRSSPRDHKRCRIARAEWQPRAGSSGYEFEVQADRFLHHMVRMLVGTMVDVALKRRAARDIGLLLEQGEGVRTSPPAPAEGLYFVEAGYPEEWYL